MSADEEREENELGEILNRVKTLSTSSRLVLARCILESVEPRQFYEKPPKLIPLKDIFGMLKTDGPPPTDEECQRIIEEERMKKFG